MFNIGSLWRVEACGRAAPVPALVLQRGTQERQIPAGAAGLTLYLTFFDDEPRAEGYSAATTEEQARNTLWGVAAQMVKRSPRLQRRIVALANRLVREDNASMFAPIAHVPGAQEGKSPHVGVIDGSTRTPTASWRTCWSWARARGGSR